MDIGQGFSQSSYTLLANHLHNAVSTMFEFICKKAVKDEMESNAKLEREATKFKVSGDGSWKKRGYTSLIGVTTLILHRQNN